MRSWRKCRGKLWGRRLVIVRMLSLPTPVAYSIPLSFSLSCSSSHIRPLTLISRYDTPGLNFVATDPSYRRRGAATQLLQWGIERSKQEGVPIYLESTVEAGPLYEGLGFVLKGVIPLEFLREETGKEGIGESGKELCFLFVP